MSKSAGITIDHPRDDPRLPSYVHPTLADLEDDLQLAYDCWQRLRGVKKQYLPKEEKEPPEAYEQRLDRAVFADFYRDAITGFAGVLSRFQLKDPPPSFDKARDNIDLEGNSVQSFMLTADCCVMRDGGVPLVVEMPPDPPEDAAQERKEDRRPYLTFYPRRMMTSWRRENVKGEEDVAHVVFLELSEEDEGTYGVKVVPRYRVIGKGFWKLFELKKSKSGRFTATEVDDGEFLDHTKKPLAYCPVVWYPAMKASFGEGDLPMAQVAEWAVAWMRKHSDITEKDHRCNMPVPVEEGGIPPQPGQEERPLVLGPNSIIRLQKGGRFYWAEPNASSLRESREQLIHIEELIRQQTLAFLFGGVAKTATQAGLEGAQTQASITTMVQQKSNAIQRIYKIWADYTGEPLQNEAGIAVAGSIFDKPLTAQDVDQMAKLVGDLLMSQQTAIEELQRSGFNRSTVSAKEELRRISREQKALAQMSAAPDPATDLADEENSGLPSSTDAPGDNGGPPPPPPGGVAPLPDQQLAG